MLYFLRVLNKIVLKIVLSPKKNTKALFLFTWLCSKNPNKAIFIADAITGIEKNRPITFSSEFTLSCLQIQHILELQRSRAIFKNYHLNRIAGYQLSRVFCRPVAAKFIPSLATSSFHNNGQWKSR